MLEMEDPATGDNIQEAVDGYGQPLLLELFFTLYLEIRKNKEIYIFEETIH